VPRRRLWDALSETYRKRLLRGGVSRGQYESGIGLSKARGHGKTPEHPREALRKPDKYPEYVAKKGRAKPGPTERDLIRTVTDKKDRFFGDRFKYDLERQIQYVRHGSVQDDVPKPSRDVLRQASVMSAEQMEELASLANGEASVYKEWRFLWYH
jgi:hypothetical protein